MSSIVNAYVESDEEHILLLHRAESGELKTHRVLADYAVYFARADVSQALLRKWLRDPFCRGYRPEGRWLRTRWRGYQPRRALVAEMHELGIPTFEGDCSPVKRWLADHPDVVIQQPRRCYLDIETDSRVKIQDAKEGRARILVWCIVDALDGSWQTGVLEDDTDAAERVLLKALYTAMDPYDQVVAWSGDDFDFPVIAKRTKERRLAGGIPRRWLRLDHLQVYKRGNMQVAESGEEKQSYALNAVAKAQLGEGKDDFDARLTYQAWLEGGAELERLVAYCHQDTDLMRRIEERTGYIALHQTIAQICGTFPDSWALLPTSRMDAYCLRLGAQRGVHFPTATKDESAFPEAQYKGSYNKAPPEHAGILKSVHVLDFSGMYPSIMVSWNMSIETRIGGPVNGPLPPGMARSPKTGICFRTDVEGIVPAAVEQLMIARKKWSAIRAELPPGTPEAHDAERWTNGVKIVPNAFYGAQGNPGCRFHDRRVAESVSQTGAWLAATTEWAIAERYPEARIIYVDTDGLWIQGIDRATATAAVEWLNTEVYPRLLREAGCVKNLVRLAYEKEFERVVFSGAKSYTGRFAHYKGTAAIAGSRPEIKGLAYKRGDAAKFTRELQAEIVDLLMGGMGISETPGPTEEIARFEEVVVRWRTRVLEEPLAVADIQTVKGLARDLNEYSKRKSTKGAEVAQPPHVRVAQMLRQRGEYVSAGMKIAYVVTDAGAKPQGVIPSRDYDGTCDRRYLWDMIWSPTCTLLENAFPGHAWAKLYDSPKKQRPVKEIVVVAPKVAKPRARKASANESLFH